MAKVLIIEDEKAMAELIMIKFKVEGFEVDHASSLSEAKKQLETSSYDVILSDFLLPDGELMDFLIKLRADTKTKNIPIVVMTNYVEDLNLAKLKELGVQEVLVKYQNVPAQMVAKVKHVIGGNTTPPLHLGSV